MQNKYICDFYVNNIRTKEEVIANDSFSARKLVQARYPNSKITWIGSPKLTKQLFKLYINN